jgi:adenine deaminase
VSLARRIAVARGDEAADLVVRGGRVLSVFTREWLECDVAVCDGYIAGIGEYDGEQVLDASGRYVVPGFIDAHVHLETTKLLAHEFARLVLPMGTTAVVADPHEIANVLGTDGVHWLLDVCAGLPLDVWFMASSCVPASAFESPRRPLTPGDLQGLLNRRRVIGLAEMMNFPGVIVGDDAELAKLALDGAGHVDGHAPGVLGKHLQAYAAAGIRSDHEAYTLEEGRERLRAGMWVLIREASVARNLRALVPLVAEFGPHRLAFCTDDREPEHVVEEGHVNSIVREAVALGVSPEDALVMATLNPATWHGLDHLGAVAPGYQADLLLLPDLEHFVPELVLKAGRPVVEIPNPVVPDWVKRSVRVAPIGSNDFHVPWPGGNARVIGLVPGQIITESLVDELTVENGFAVADPERDLAKLAVVERHHGTGRIGLGFVRGFGLQRGAFASTVAHDAHNIVVVGVDDGDIARAVQRLGELGGGMVVVESRGVRAELALPVAGLLSEAPAADVAEGSRACVAELAELGCTVEAPFQALAFLALSVIPSLKLTDQGLVDVDQFRLVPLAMD